MSGSSSSKESLVIPLQSVTPPRRGSGFDVLDLPILGRFLRWRRARISLQIPLFIVAAIMIWDGLTGSQLAPKNLATTITWVHYRGLLILGLLVAGNLFCMACPFMLPRNLARRFFQPTRMLPRYLRNKWAAIVILGLFFFLYELFDLWATPWWTAWVIVIYFAAALLIDSLFKGAPFCKYICPLGQFNFASSLVSPLEVNIRDPQVCRSCRTKDCIKGNEQVNGCELWLFQERKVGNMDCTFCLDCIHACPYDNVGISARIPGSELLTNSFRSGIGWFSRRLDMSVLMIIFTFGALINAFGMVSPVYALQAWMAEVFNTQNEAPILGSIFFVGLVIEPLILLTIAGVVTQRWAGQTDSLLAIITRYAYALVPLGFGVWVAHYLFHFLIGFWTFVPLTQSLLAEFGITVLGSPRWELGPLAPEGFLNPVEWGFIGLGCFGSLLIAYQIARRDAPQHPWRAFLPWAVLVLSLTVVGFWLMALPMEMRGTSFG
ncbi:MAG: FesM [Chloroflexota bacterium]